MQGKRIYEKDGNISNLNNGEYGYCEKYSKIKGQEIWIAKTPNGDPVILINGGNHTIVENKDATITVNPSIVTKNWHGWLKNGIWQSV